LSAKAWCKPSLRFVAFCSTSRRLSDLTDFLEAVYSR